MKTLDITVVNSGCFLVCQMSKTKDRKEYKKHPSVIYHLGIRYHKTSWDDMGAVRYDASVPNEDRRRG